MKYLIVLMLLLLSATLTYSKDITIKIVNPNQIALTPYVGMIALKDNSKSDDEIIDGRQALQIKNAGRALAAGKKTQVAKYDVPGNQILIVFGIYSGGGRTEVYRFKIRDIKKDVTVSFKEYTIYKPEPNYLYIAKMLDSIHNLGAYYQASSSKIAGNFVFFDVSDETYQNVFLSEPKNPLTFAKTKAVTTTVGDLLYKNASYPVSDLSGKILLKPTEQSSGTFKELIIPGMEKKTEIFGAADFKFLNWKISNSSDISVKLNGETYLDLFNSCDQVEKNKILNKFKTTVNPNDSTEFHLFFISSVHHTDTIRITFNETRAIEPNEVLEDYDVTTPKGNFRFTGDEKTIYSITNVISNVIATDVTPLLYYLYIRDNKFPPTAESAINCLEAYKKIDGFFDLPDLDDKAMEMTVPAYTINKVKEIVVTANVLSAIENKCATISSPIIYYKIK